MLQTTSYKDGHTYKIMTKYFGDRIIIGTQQGSILNNHVTFINVTWENGNPLIQTSDNTPCTINIDVEDIVCKVDITDTL